MFLVYNEVAFKNATSFVQDTEMTKKEILINEIKEIPEPFIDEILDFVQFLKEKITREKMDAMMISESSLSKDWLKPDEDKAWQNL